MLFLHWTHPFESQLVKNFFITVLSSLIYLRENTGNSTGSRPICTLFSQWTHELILWMSFQELINGTCPLSSLPPSLSHLYCCLQVSTVVHNYHFCLPAGSQPEDKLYEETPPLCTSKSSELINVAFQGSTQQTLNEWRPCSPNSISETAGWSPASGQWGYHHAKATCLAGSGFLPILPSLSFSDLLHHLVFRRGKEVEEQRKSMQKLRHSPWHIADTQQWPATWWQDCRQQSEDMKWLWRGSNVSWSDLIAVSLSAQWEICLGFQNWISSDIFPFFSYNGKWSIKSCAWPTAFITDLWRDVGI